MEPKIQDWTTTSSASQNTSSTVTDETLIVDSQRNPLRGDNEAAIKSCDSTWDRSFRDSMRTLEPEDLEEIIGNLSLGFGDQITVTKTKGPNSIPGTGSSIASASDFSEASDFESDSGIENSNVDVVKPKLSTLSLTFKKKKGVKTGGGEGLGSCVKGSQSPEDNGPSGIDSPSLESGCNSSNGLSDATQSPVPGGEGRIAQLIQCIDHKVSEKSGEVKGIIDWWSVSVVGRGHRYKLCDHFLVTILESGK